MSTKGKYLTSPYRVRQVTEGLPTFDDMCTHAINQHSIQAAGFTSVDDKAALTSGIDVTTVTDLCTSNQR